MDSSNAAGSYDSRSARSYDARSTGSHGPDNTRPDNTGSYSSGNTRSYDPENSGSLSPGSAGSYVARNTGSNSPGSAGSYDARNTGSNSPGSAGSYDARNTGSHSPGSARSDGRGNTGSLGSGNARPGDSRGSGSYDLDVRPEVSGGSENEDWLKQLRGAIALDPDERLPHVKFSPPGRFKISPQDDVKKMLERGNVLELQKYIRDNIRKINTSIYIEHELKKVVERFAPNEYREDMEPLELMKIVRDLLVMYERQTPLFDISLEGVEVLEGSALAAKIELSRKKVCDIIQDLQNKVQDAENAAHIWQVINQQTKADAERYWEALTSMTSNQQYARPRFVGEDFPADDSFVRELEYHLKKQNAMNSSLKEELALEEKSKNELIQQVLYLKEITIQDEHDKMKEIADVAKTMELEEALKTAITQKIRSLSSNPEEITEALNTWMNALQEKIWPRKEEIEHLMEAVASVEDELANLTVEYDDARQKCAEVQDGIEALQEQYDEKLEELDYKESELQEINRSIQQMKDTIKQQQSRASSMYSTPTQPYGSSVVSPPYYDARSTPQYGVEPSGSRYIPEFRRELDVSDQSRTPDSSRTTDPEYSAYTDESPERPRFGSPEFSPRYYTQSSPISLNSTPSSHVSFSTSPPSPIHLNTPSPLLQSQRTYMKTPGTETLSHPLSRLSSRSATRTPDQFVTPFISKTRFGYTDPTAKVLNIPPGDDLEIPSAYKQKFLLPSPRRENPMVVDIGVDPKPLIQTATGEHFVCDISLSLQPSGQQQEMSPVFTYDSPPAVTPTTDRRHGLFTPKGIFQKKHFNVRRIHSPEEYESPDLPWSPQYLPKDARSPIAYLPTSPDYSDRSISWEKSPERPIISGLLNKTFEAPSAFNRTFEARSPRSMNRTFDKSPVRPLNTTFDATSPYISNRTFDKSPARPLNTTFDATSPKIGNRTFDKSPIQPLNTTFDTVSPYIMNRTFAASSPPVMDTTFNRSGRPVLNRTFDTSSPHVLGRTFNASSPRTMNRTFNMSASPVLNQTFNRTRSPVLNKTFDQSTSPALNQTFNRTRSPVLNKTYDRSPSPALNQTFDKTRSPVLNKTSDRSPLPSLNRTFNFSASPAMNKTFDKSRSPSPNKTFGVPAENLVPRDQNTTFNHSFNQTNSPEMNATFDSTYSGNCCMYPNTDGTFNRSPRLNETFEESLSPESSGPSDHNSPQFDGTFNRSSSPPLNTTFDLSASDHEEPLALNKSFIYKPDA